LEVVEGGVRIDLIAAGMFNQGGSDALRGWYLRVPPDR